MSDKDESAGRDESTGRFLPGNRFWEARSSHGRNPIFRTADELWGACVEYFEWVEENPLYEAKAFAYQGEVTMANLPKMRAMTIGGLCLFLDIDRTTWNDWRENRSDFSHVIAAAEEVMRKQKFEGAAAELLNANIISRDLGLADEQRLTGKDGERLIPEHSDEEIARRAAFLLAKGVQGRKPEGEEG